MGKMQSNSSGRAVNSPIATLVYDMAALRAYLSVCVRREDWHGVADAANDLRVLQALLDEARGKE